MIDKLICALLIYAEEHSLIEKSDRIYTLNTLLSILGKDTYEPSDDNSELPLDAILSGMCDYAEEKGLCGTTVAQRDLFDTKIMGALTPRPSSVISEFKCEYDKSPECATDFYYNFSKATNYIRTERVKKDRRWTVQSKYGVIDISINLSKPEKDPKDIAAAKLLPQSGYPKCLLCPECEGYSGRADFPARENHRIIPITLGGDSWFLQYSPYVYYNEHCIVLNSKHTPMTISDKTIEKLLDFVTLFPHYFIGSNADLPIVGGSILSHEHFQGGRYDFAMAKADTKSKLIFKGFEDIDAGILNWPLSVVRLKAKDRERLQSLSSLLIKSWRSYTDEKAFIFAQTDGERHSTVTPIARRRGDDYEFDIVLRNNITTAEHPLGVYHPHSECHHIKKENIGLIEVMGLAVLPARLQKDIPLMEKYLLYKTEDEKLQPHIEWLRKLSKTEKITEDNVQAVIQNGIGDVFVTALEHAGVFKNNADFMRFITNAGGRKA